MSATLVGALAATPAGVLPTVASAGALGASGVAVWLTRKPVLRQRWITWALALPVLWCALALGRPATAALVIGLAIVASLEYVRLIGAPRGDRMLLLGAATGLPILALCRPGWLGHAPLLLLLAAAAPLVRGDTTGGLRRAALTGFGAIWISWSLAHLVLLWQHGYLLCLAVATADVAAWSAGTGLRRIPPMAAPLSPLSPGKTWGGVLGSVSGAGLVLAVAGSFGVLAMLAVGLGAVFGDLLESMAKREAGVKDAGGWLPGFGGLLDRVDSLLVVLPLTAALIHLGWVAL